MNKIPELFGSMVFNDDAMKERLPKETYKALKNCIMKGKPLDLSIANVVANAMKDWATNKGVTHFTHWFQPMTGITAEKHDSFISATSDGKVIMEFSGKELIKGEADASSFPSGGIRATFEARGYTAWDPTSYAFIKDGILCIPTAFCSYGGEALDKKTPLLRSMEAVNIQALRILKLFGNNEVKRVYTNAGPEQEYFLIDKEMFEKRKDLKYTGRTLFGAKPPKGQEMDDHYYGAIRPRVCAFMKELDEELWQLGILAKTKHNEVAPSQHELATIYSTTNISTDHNQLTMEIMKRVALKHNMACLLHEKPFQGFNGSGKHNNWSMSTDTGLNLLDPGVLPHENAQFLLFLCAVIRAVDEHQDLLRLSVATASNDYRLGGHEAPPAIISIFLGDELTDILTAMAEGRPYNSATKQEMKIGVDVLPNFPQDTTDRNRTSPFAFTGNRFEFRMVGSMLSIAGPNIILNAIVADVLCSFADELEKATDFSLALNKIIKNTIKNHRRIIFNGNNYSDEWRKKAEERKLLILESAAESLPYFVEKKNIALFVKHKVFTPAEVESRCKILLELYCKSIHIEAATMVEMVRKDVIPAACAYVRELCETADIKEKTKVCGTVEKHIAGIVAPLCDAAIKQVYALEDVISRAEEIKNLVSCAHSYRYYVIPAMEKLRATVDELEVQVASKYWPMPTYEEILFSV